MRCADPHNYSQVLDERFRCPGPGTCFFWSRGKVLFYPWLLETSEEPLSRNSAFPFWETFAFDMHKPATAPVVGDSTEKLLYRYLYII